MSFHGYTTPWAGTDVPEARAYKKFLVKQRSYFLRWGEVTDMSPTSSSTGSVAATSTLNPAGGTLPCVWPFGCGCVGNCAISIRLLFDAGPSWGSAEPSRSYTKLAMSLNKVVRAGVSNHAKRSSLAGLSSVRTIHLPQLRISCCSLFSSALSSH